MASERQGAKKKATPDTGTAFIVKGKVPDSARTASHVRVINRSTEPICCAIYYCPRVQRWISGTMTRCSPVMVVQHGNVAVIPKPRILANSSRQLLFLPLEAACVDAVELNLTGTPTRGEPGTPPRVGCTKEKLPRTVSRCSSGARLTRHASKDIAPRPLIQGAFNGDVGVLKEKISSKFYTRFYSTSMTVCDDIYLLYDEGRLCSMTKFSFSRLPEVKREGRPPHLSYGSKAAINRASPEEHAKALGGRASTHEVHERTEEVAHVRVSSDIPEEERRAVEHRERTIAAPRMEELLGLERGAFDDEELRKCMPRVAFAGSGGGCRAMVCTLGSLLGMEQAGLLDCCSYVAGVSGSCWSIATWMAFGSTGEDAIMRLRAHFTERMTLGLAKVYVLFRKEEWARIIWRKWGYGQSVQLVDLYGAKLAQVLLHNTTVRAGYDYRLSHMRQVCDPAATAMSSTTPIPILTAVQQEPSGEFEWFEFTPWEVGSEYLGSYVPSWAFGRYFSDGVSVDRADEHSLGMLMAVFGSAYCATLQRISDELSLRTADDDSSQLQAAVPTFRSACNVEDTLEKLEEDNLLLSSATYPLDVQQDVVAAEEEHEQEDDQAYEELLSSLPTRAHFGSLEGDEELTTVHGEHVSTTAGGGAVDGRKDHRSEHGEDDAEKKKKASFTQKLLKQLYDPERAGPSVDALLSFTGLSEMHALPPAEFYNYTYRADVGPLTKVKALKLCDAGIGINLPFPPLLRQARGVDVIIATNHSKWPNIASNFALEALKRYAELRGIQIPPMDLGPGLHKKVVTVFMDAESDDSPVIIYLPLTANPRYGEFDPQKNIQEGGYCNTFNFEYTAEQIEELSGLTAFNMREAVPVIKKVLKIVYKRKLRKRGLDTRSGSCSTDGENSDVTVSGGAEVRCWEEKEGCT